MLANRSNEKGMKLPAIEYIVPNSCKIHVRSVVRIFNVIRVDQIKYIILLFVHIR